MGAADLVADNARKLSAEFAREALPGGGGELDTGFEEELALGEHVEAVAGAVALTEVVGVGIGTGDGAEEARSLRREGLVAEDGGGGAGADGEVGEVGFDFLAGERGGEKRLEGALEQGAAVLAGDEEGGLDLAGLYQTGCDDHAVEEPEAGAREVKNLAVRGKREELVHVGGGGGLEAVAADGAVYEKVDTLGRHGGLREGACAGLGGDGGGERVAGPEAAGVDAGHEFEAASGELEALVERSEALLDVGGGDLLGRCRSDDTTEANGVEIHGRVAARTTSSSK